MHSAEEIECTNARRRKRRGVLEGNELVNSGTVLSDDKTVPASGFSSIGERYTEWTRRFPNRHGYTALGIFIGDVILVFRYGATSGTRPRLIRSVE